MNGQKYVDVIISKDGKTVTAEAENFNGVGCEAALDALNSMGTVTNSELKGEYYDAQNHSCLSNSL